MPRASTAALLRGGGVNGANANANQDNRKRKRAEESGSNKRRAALGEITNAFVETKSQAKKGINKIIGKTKSGSSNRNSSSQRSEASSHNKRWGARENCFLTYYYYRNVALY